MRCLRCLPLIAFGLVLGCAGSRQPLPTARGPLSLSRVVLYRNGVGYFERTGVISGDRLTLKVRKDQVNDLLKSLTVIDRGSGKALSLSIPLDPRVWQDAALALLMPGSGRLADVLDRLRGTRVRVSTGERKLEGRIVLVERIEQLPRPMRQPGPLPGGEDHRLTLLDGEKLQVVRLSAVTTVALLDGDLVMQLDRHLDASAGEGMFQQVDVVVRLSGAGRHDLAVSYVVAAPRWKPTYRVVLAEDGSGKALLQAWGVVSNVSGENWDDVALSLTAGAPLAFRYDLHTPEDVERPDLTGSAVHKQAQVSLGETTYAGAADEPLSGLVDEDLAEERPMPQASAPAEEGAAAGMSMERMAKRAMKARPARPEAPPPAVTMEQLQRSASAAATAKRVSGLTRFDLPARVSLPDGSASMVLLVSELVPGEETFLYKPGGSGVGYEQNPYRVVRFKNATDFVLEPGPLSIYAGGSFVGEGLSEAIAARDHATIPFAAEPELLVRQSTEASGDELRIVKIVRGVMEVESFHRVVTTWKVQGKPRAAGYRVLVRQPRAGDAYELVKPPPGTETLPDGYFLPVVVAPNQGEASLQVVERTPSRYTLTLWDDKVPELLAQLLQTSKLDEKARAKLAPIVAARAELGRIDTQLSGLNAQQQELDERAGQERQNLEAIKKDPRAAALRKRLSDRLEELTKQADVLGRKIVELTSERLAKKIDLEDRMRDLDLTP